VADRTLPVSAKRSLPTRRNLIHRVTAISALCILGDKVAAEPATHESKSDASSSARPRAKSSPWLSLPPTPELPPASQSDLVSINGTQIFFAQFGSGPSVLFLHGGMGNSNYWGHQVPELAKNFSVTVMDTRGHGRSPVTSRAFSYRTFADDAVGLLDHLGIANTAIIGWSDGAVTGLDLAINKGERISKLFAFGGNSSLDGMKGNSGRSGVFASYAARCRQEYLHLSPHPERWPQLMDGLRIMWRTQPTYSSRELASIKLPTTIADGQYDEIIKRDHLERMARTIPHAKLVIQPSVSHFAMLQDPNGFNVALREFLEA
jgi:pimeloyl-ACP methyl ester carboxylesterase